MVAKRHDPLLWDSGSGLDDLSQAADGSGLELFQPFVGRNEDAVRITGPVRDPITIILLGEPVGFARMRIGGGIHYMPKPQRNITASLKIEAGNVMKELGAAPFDEPIAVELLAEFSIPQGWSKRKRADAILGRVRPGKRPDIDNLYKLAADALNAVVYRDDCLVVDMHCRKIYGPQPKIVVTVRAAAAGAP